MKHPRPKFGIPGDTLRRIGRVLLLLACAAAPMYAQTQCEIWSAPNSMMAVSSNYYDFVQFGDWFIPALGWQHIHIYSTSPQAHYGHDGKYLLPDPVMTPGQANSLLVADLSGKSHMAVIPWSKKEAEANVCAKDFRTGPWRHVSEKEKKAACLEYGITSGCPGKGYELDHACSLEFGCSDSILNMWPQPILQARVKDHQVEDKLPALVCSGRMTLKEAQDCADHDWVACMVTISKLEGKK